MADNKQRTAREIAAWVLNKFNAKGNFAGVILDKELSRTEQRQRATDLVFGTIRNREAIDFIIATFAGCPADRIPIKALNIIRVGVYELAWCPLAAEYAIVNEAVENAKKAAGRKQGGFVNAVLRNICRHIKNRQVCPAESDVKKTLPQTLSTGCEFDVEILPAFEKSAVEYLCRVFSLPTWLVSGWVDEYGAESARQICFASNRRPSVYVRVNRLKTTTKQLAERFCQAEIDFEISADNSMLRIKSPRAVSRLPGYSDGLFSVQDMTAYQAATTLAPGPGWKILDLCAAPGTKTTQLAELTGDEAEIYATDIDSRRLEKVEENCTRLVLKSVTVLAYDNLGNFIKKQGSVDAVLLDVPCSNTGVLARRPEVRFRIEKKAITKLTKIQGELLEKAAGIVKPGGEICYSTCSIEPSENGGVVREFLEKNKNFELEKEKLTLPSAQEPNHDGGYVAILKAVSL